MVNQLGSRAPLAFFVEFFTRIDMEVKVPGLDMSYAGIIILVGGMNLQGSLMRDENPKVESDFQD